jgi:hypothetical protein
MAVTVRQNILSPNSLNGFSLHLVLVGLDQRSPAKLIRVYRYAAYEFQV